MKIPFIRFSCGTVPHLMHHTGCCSVMRQVLKAFMEGRKMEKNKPAWSVQLGAIRCSIFFNRNADGRTFANVGISRRFKQGSEWMTSTTFNGLADLALVKQAVELAIEWLSTHDAEAA